MSKIAIAAFVASVVVPVVGFMNVTPSHANEPLVINGQVQSSGNACTEWTCPPR